MNMRLVTLLLVLLSVVALATAGCVTRDDVQPTAGGPAEGDATDPPADDEERRATTPSESTAEAVHIVNGVRCTEPSRDVVVLDWQRPDGVTAMEGSTSFEMPDQVTHVRTQLRSDASAGEWNREIEGPSAVAFSAGATSVESRHPGLHTSINVVGGMGTWTGERAPGTYTLSWMFSGASVGFGLEVTATVC